MFKFDYQDYIPKSFVCWKEGYTPKLFWNDLLAGLTVGVISVPLAMAFAIGSGVTPERGLFTAIIAGFLISLLGGSRVQIGGPTGAFIVIVYGIVQRHGYDGLVIATLLGGLIMVIMGIARFGVILKFIPYSVTTGFTTGIACCIFTSQIKDFFGLSIASVPSEFLNKWLAYIQTAHTLNPWAFVLAAGSLASIFIFRRINPKLPGSIFAIIGATALAYAFELPIETIESKFGSIPNMLPSPVFPDISFERIQLLFPDALTVAMLGAIESLLSAVVADGMTGMRHRSNCELVGQGLANMASALFGGIPATGAIARTTANIKLNAKTPMAGMIHAVTVLILMMFCAPLAAKVPLCSFAAVLIFVAWNMSELDHFFDILKGPPSDIVVLVATFLLTVLIDLTAAVQVGVLLSAVLFLKRMTDSTTVKICKILLKQNAEEHPEMHDSEIIFRDDVPEDVSVFEIDGPFFFGIADALNEQLRRTYPAPKFFILRMRKVPLVDATGVNALKQFHSKCQRQGIVFMLSGVQDEMKAFLEKTGVVQTLGKECIFPHLDDALASARRQLPLKAPSSTPVYAS